MNSKIALGTAQFGLDYGINNKRGKIPFSEVEQIIKLCYDNGIGMLDTAFSYGDSEDVIGAILVKNNYNFNIISKLPSKALPNNVLFHFKKSLERLKQNELYGYLLHNFKTFKKYPEIWKILQDLKNSKNVKKIGFSLYYPSELDYLFKNNIDFDIIQIPYSIFDQRFENYFFELKKRNIEIHVRSVFLQGLFFKKQRELSENFIKIREKIKIINQMSKNMITSIASVCLEFALMNKKIDKVVIGVDNIKNLQDNLREIKVNRIKDKYYNLLKNMRVNDENITLPFKWKFFA